MKPSLHLFFAHASPFAPTSNALPAGAPPPPPPSPGGAFGRVDHPFSHLSSPSKQDKSPVFLASPAYSSPPSPSAPVLKKSALDRLARLYSCCILSKLTPEVVTELVLLFKLLSIKSSDVLCGGVYDRRGEGKAALAKYEEVLSILPNGSSCRYLASETLYGIVPLVKVMFMETLTSLNSFAPLSKHCRFVANAVSEALEGSFAPVGFHRDGADDCDGFGGFFAVPFDEQRDSRHHYKSSEEQRVYSEREKARDSFLSLLAKWRGYKGKFDVCNLTKFKENLGAEARALMSKLFMFGNVVW